MEQKNNVDGQTTIQQPESIIAPLQKVTPVSKYLALGLFIILPFVGAWVGYTLTPEKVIEVQVPDMKILVDKRKTDTQINDTQINNIQKNSESQSTVSPIPSSNGLVISYECTSVENPYPHECFSFKPKSPEAEGIKNVTEEAKIQGVISGRIAIQAIKYKTTDDSKIYFTVGIPESDNCCNLIAFNVNTYKFNRVDLFGDSFSSFWSTDNRYFTSVENNTTLYTVDLETEKMLGRVVISQGSLVSSKCGFVGDEYDVTFNVEKQGFDYGIYSENTESGNECKQEKIRYDFIPLKQM